MCALPACISGNHMHASGPLELELQIADSCHVSDGSQTQVNKQSKGGGAKTADASGPSAVAADAVSRALRSDARQPLGTQWPAAPSASPAQPSAGA